MGDFKEQRVAFSEKICQKLHFFWETGREEEGGLKEKGRETQDES